MEEFIQKTLELPSDQPLEITKLFGQASSRQYFRATLKGHALGSVLIMKMPNGFSSPAEEITKLEDGAPQEFSFLNVQKYLEKCGVKVPKIYGLDEAQGLMLLQDLGDQSLEAVVEKAEGEYFLFYYKKAIDTLIDFQKKAKQDKTCVAFYKTFSKDLLNWEFDHYLEFGIEDRFQKKCSDDQKQVFKTTTRKLSDLISQMPYGLTHRDFQSRNLMFYGYEFYLIDFQDALKGTVLYDLVALLNDSYIEFAPEQLDALLHYYAESLPSTHAYFEKQDQLVKDFHIISLQRKLKDVGRFQYILTVKKNDQFIQHVNLTIDKIQNSLNWLKSNTDLLSEKFIKFIQEHLIKD